MSKRDKRVAEPKHQEKKEEPPKEEKPIVIADNSQKTIGEPGRNARKLAICNKNKK